MFRKWIKTVKMVGTNLLGMITSANLASDLLQRSKPDDSFAIKHKEAEKYIALLKTWTPDSHEEPLTIEAAYTLIHTGNWKIVPIYLEKFSLKPEDYINIAMEMTGSMQRVDYISALAENRKKFEEKWVNFNDIFDSKIRTLAGSLHFRNADRFREIFEEHATSDYGENVLAHSPWEKVRLINEWDLAEDNAKKALNSIEKDGVEIRLKSDKKYYFVSKDGKRLHFAPLSESELKSMYLSEDWRIGCSERDQFIYVPKRFKLPGWTSN